MPRTHLIDQLRPPTEAEPLRLLSSACLMGTMCGYDGSSYGEFPKTKNLQRHPRVQLLPFCPIFQT